MLDNRLPFQLKLSIAVDFLLRIIGLASFTLFIASVYTTSGKTMDIGYISLVTFVPSLFITWYSGHFFSKYSTFQIFNWTSLGRVLCFLGAVLYHSSLLSLFLFAAFHSLLHQLSLTSKMSIDSELVNDRTRTNFLSVKSLFSNVVIIIGPPIGGVLVATTGIKAALYVMCFLSLMLYYVQRKLLKYQIHQTSLLIQSKVSLLPQTHHDKNTDLLSILKEVWKTPTTFSVIIAYCIIAILLEIQAPLIFPFVKEVYGKDAGFASFLLGLAGFGGVIGAFIPKLFPHFLKGKVMPYLILFDGAVFGVFTLMDSPHVSSILFLFLGLMGSMTLILVESVVQTELPPSHRPPVFSLMQFSGGAGGAATGIFTSYCAGLFGTQNVLTSAAGLELLCGFFCLILFLQVERGNLK